MEIELHNARRKFGAQLVFDKLSRHFPPGCRIAVLGGNGSGKSTFLKTLYGALSLSSGQIFHRRDGQQLEGYALARHISFSAPYFELIEELSALEFLTFTQRFRHFRKGLSANELLERALLGASAHKSISHFSSGMKQRLKLSLALFAESEIVLLDEPTSNLDPAGVRWYRELVASEIGARSLFVGSNFSDSETALCKESVELRDYQHSKD